MALSDPPFGHHGAMVMFVKVLIRKYSDNSAFEVVRVYVNDEARAKSDFELVGDGSFWNYELIDVPAILGEAFAKNIQGSTA